MNIKRNIMVATFTLLFIIGGYLVFSIIPHKIVNINPSEVSVIKVFDGNTGKGISITDKSDINHIIKNLNAITFKKDSWSLFRLGYSFKTTIYNSNGGIYKEFIINSADTIRADPFFYKDETSSIDYDYIRDLVKKQGG